MSMRIKNGQQYYERKDIIDKYNYSQTTFDKKSRYGLKKYPDKIMNPHKGVWFIHPDILEEIYVPKRGPNRDNRKGIKSWVLNTTWDYIGCIYPRKSTLEENIKRIEFIFDEIKRRYRGLSITLFYSIEYNRKEESSCYSERHSHIHFLINMNSNQRLKPVYNGIRQILNEYSDSKVFFEPFKKEWEIEGKEYTIKELLSKEFRNYDYLIFKSKSKSNV